MFNPFYYALAYVVLAYLRLHEYVPALIGVPILPTALGLSLMLWLFMREKNFDAPQYKLLPALLLTMMASAAVNGWLGGALKDFSEFAPFVLLFYLIATTTNSLAKQRFFALAQVAIAVVLALHGIDQLETGTGWTGAKVSQGTRITYLGFFNDPNDLALAFVISVPMLIYCFAHARRTIVRGVLIAGLGFVLYGLFLTNSRGGTLALAALMGMYSWQRLGVIKTMFFGVPAVLLLIFLPSRMGMLSASEASAAGRVDAWYEGLQMLFARPFLGVGKGNFGDYNALTAHNSFILVLSEIGLIGYFLWLSFVGLSLYMMYSVQRWPAPSEDAAATWPDYQRVARMLLYALVGFLVGAFFLSRSYSLQLVVLCALAVAHYQTVRRTWPSFPEITLQGTFWTFVILAFGSVAFFYVLVKVLL